MSDPIGQETPQSQYTIKATDHTDESHSGISEKARQRLQSAKEKASEALDSGRHAVESGRRVASERYQRVKSEASRAYEDGVESVRTSFQQRPLAFALGAFAAGIVIGMLLPTSKPERRALSSAAERMRAQGENLAARGREAVQEATRAAEQKIRGSEEPG